MKLSWRNFSHVESISPQRTTLNSVSYFNKYAYFLVKLLIIFFSLYLLCNYFDCNFFYDVCYAEDDDYNRKFRGYTAWDLRYDPSLNPHGMRNTLLDLTAFALWWGAFVLVTIWK